MNGAEAIKGLYAVTTPLDGGSASLVAATDAAIRGGARVVQYRDKTDDTARRRDEALALQAVTRRYGACFIVNDDVELAADIGADGVHLGSDDAALSSARDRLGRDALIGVSCYNELARGDRAVAEGADYLAFGSAFPSPTKPDAPRAGPELLARARERFRLPLVAIGGIDAGNAGLLAQAGVDAVAVVTAVYHADDPAAAAQALVAAIG